MNLENLELAKTHDYSATDSPELTAIFIHGIAATSQSFNKAFEALENVETLKKVRFIAFDLLGAGESLTSDDLEYTFDEQIAALKNSIAKLNIKTPIVLVGHSMGTLISTRYATLNPEGIKKLILVSPPIYSPEDMQNPAFPIAINGFRSVIGRTNPKIIESKVFNNELDNMVTNPDNYNYLKNLQIPAVLIYGALDEIIASYNIPHMLELNPNLTAVETEDAHGVSILKTAKILTELEKILEEL